MSGWGSCPGNRPPRAPGARATSMLKTPQIHHGGTEARRKMPKKLRVSVPCMFHAQGNDLGRRHEVGGRGRRLKTCEVVDNARLCVESCGDGRPIVPRARARHGAGVAIAQVSGKLERLDEGELESAQGWAMPEAV